MSGAFITWARAATESSDTNTIDGAQDEQPEHNNPDADEAAKSAATSGLV